MGNNGVAIETYAVLSLVIMVILAACYLMDLSGVAAHNFEETQRFNYMNFQYVFVVLLGIGCIFVGFIAVMWLYFQAKKELKNLNVEK